MSKMMVLTLNSMNNEMNPKVRQEMKDKVRVLAYERREMYKGNKDVVNKVLTSYSDQIKKHHQS